MAKPYRPKAAAGILNDSAKMDLARELSELARPHLGRAVEVLREVMDDVKSRKRVDAAKAMVEFATGGEMGVASQGGNMQVLVVASNDLDQIEREMRTKRAIQVPAMLEEGDE